MARKGKRITLGGRGGLGNSNAGRLVIAHRISLARSQAGLTGRQLAKLLNTSPTTIHNIEKGKQKIDTEILERVSVALGKPIRWFLGEDVVADRYRSAEVIITDLKQTIKNYLPVYNGVEEYASVVDNVPILQEGLSVSTLKAFRIDGVHCEPMVRPGDILVVDVKRKPVAGDHVLLKYQGKVSCGLYGIEKGRHYLASPYETWHYEDVQIVGVLVQLTRSVIPGIPPLPPPASE